MPDFSDHEDSLFSEERRAEERKHEDHTFTKIFLSVAFLGLCMTLLLWYFKK